MPAHVITSEQQRDRMLHTPIPRLILSLCLPTLATQLISVFYNTADTYFVSKLSTSASAAVGVVFSLMSIIQAFGFGIGMGCGSIISRSLGGKDNDRADRIGSSAFVFAAAVGLALCAAGLCTLRPLMRLLGSTDTILPYAESYARIILLAAPVMCASFVLSNVLRAEGEATLSMYGMCVGGLLNMGLDPLFIFVFEMGIAGAALATALSQLVSFLILGWQFLHGRSIVRLRLQAVSRSLRDIAYKALKARDRLAERMGREPNVTELAEELKLPREDVVFALEAIQDPVSLFEPVYNDGGDALYIMDQVTDNKRPDNNWLDVIGVREALSRLSEREKHILTLRFFQGRTQMEVAGEIGISQAQVSRLEKAALSHMRKLV